MREKPSPLTQGHPVPMLFGRYRLMSTLSRGPRGTVYEAFDPDTRRRVALRVVPLPPASTRRGLLQRWRIRRRDRAVAGLAHANIVALLDHGHARESQFIATEFVEGLPLPAYLESVGPLPVLQGLALAVQLLAALGFAHQRRQVHGAIQPENLLVTRAGQLKVAGFGWAAGDPGAPVPGRFHVPLYLAPEQLRGAPADAHADLYSAALVARLLLGGGSPSDLGTSLPPKVAAVFARALAVQTQDRYPDADSLCAALQEAVGAPVWNRAASPAPLVSAEEPNELEARGVHDPAPALTTSPELLPEWSPEVELTTSEVVKSEPVSWSTAEAAVFTRFAAIEPPAVEPEPVARVMDAQASEMPVPASPAAGSGHPVTAAVSVAQATPVAPVPPQAQQGHETVRESERPAPVAAHTAPVQATLAPGAATPHRRHRKRGFALAAAVASLLILGAALLQREPAPDSVATANVEPAEAATAASPAPAAIDSVPVARNPAPAVMGAAPAVTGPAPTVTGAAPAVTGPAPAVTGPAPAVTGAAPAVMGAAPAVDAPAPLPTNPAPPRPETAQAPSSSAPVATSQGTAARTRADATVPDRPQVRRMPQREVTQESQEARVAPARRPLPRVDSSQQRAGDSTRGPRDQAGSTEARRTSRPQVAQAYDLHVGCRQDATLTREVCKAIRCASSEFERHPVCVRRVAEQRARDTERELYSGGR